MKFGHLLVSSSILAGAVFAIATIPISTVGSESIEVRLQDRSLFASDFKELAAPYLGVATVLSLGTGFMALTFGGWRQASRQLGKSELAISQLQQEVQEKKAALEKLMFSEKQLQKTGLDMFLDRENPFSEHQANSSVSVNPFEAAGSQVMHHGGKAKVADPVEESDQLQRLLKELKQITSQIEGLESSQVDTQYHTVSQQ